MIRLAVDSDVPRLVEMGLRFRRETAYTAHFSENVTQMAKLTRWLIEGGGVLVSERDTRIVAMIGFYVFPHFLSGEMTAGEVFWWVEPEHRGGADGVRLLRAAENQAGQLGAARMQMIAPTDVVGTIYKRLGYTFVESGYQKTL